MNNVRWSQILGVVLPILGVAIEVWDSINQSKLQEIEMHEFEIEMAKKYGLMEVQHED